MGFIPNTPGRRTLLRGALALTGSAATALALGSCGVGSLRFGQPASYTPPAPGIDDLYRKDILAAITAFKTAAAHYTFAPNSADADAASVFQKLPSTYTLSLDWHLRAFRTGAENEQGAASDKGASASTESASAPQPTALSGADAVADALSHITALRDLTASAALQTSSTFARLASSCSGWAEWAGGVSSRYAQANGVTAPAFAEFTAPQTLRDVPASDPPVMADPHSALEPLTAAQQDEWFAGYALEVAAARTQGSEREALLTHVTWHRSLAEQYGKIALALGGTAEPREAGYAIPSPFDAAAISREVLGSMSRTLTSGVELVGLVPLEQRPVPLKAVLDSTKALSDRSSTLQPLPGITTK